MARNSSAGVYVREIDQSQHVVGASSSIGVIVGETLRGPVMERTLVTGIKQFIETFGKPNAKISFMNHCALAFLNEGSQLWVTRVAPEALYGGARVYMDNNLSMGSSWSSGIDNPDTYVFAPNELFMVYGANQGEWTSDISVHLYPNTIANDNTFYVEVYTANVAQPVERHLVSLDFALDGYGVQLNIENHINKRSRYIRVKQNYENLDYVATPDRAFINSIVVVPIVGGTNGRKATTGEIIQAWDLYENPEEVDINILINGGYSIPAIQLRMAQLAESRKDCMAILDMPPLEQRMQDAINYRRNELNLDSSYAALYSPDYLILDQYNDIRLYVPPSGHVAAAYAYTDNNFELWFAPAGMNRGNLNVEGVREVYNQGDRDALYDNQINATRVIRGAGIKIWAADTLQVTASALSNVNVRRLMIYLEKSLSLAALHSVFDPNDAILRAQLTELCERFLRPIQSARGVYDFGVVCDESNNKPETIAAGDLILDVYVDPVIPAKRIYFNAVITKTGARVTSSL